MHISLRCEPRWARFLCCLSRKEEALVKTIQIACWDAGGKASQSAYALAVDVALGRLVGQYVEAREEGVKCRPDLAAENAGEVSCNLCTYAGRRFGAILDECRCCGGLADGAFEEELECARSVFGNCVCSAK